MPKPASSKRSDMTRAKIISTAETLFARHGVNGVSLNQIIQKARLKNVNAVHYHFGNKTGLLQALVDKHLTRISERRKVILDALASRDDHTIRDLVEALVLPVAQQMEEADGGEEFIHINAELNALKTLSFFVPIDNPLRLSYENQLILLFRSQLSHLPRILVQKRMMLIAGMLYHGLSDHARMREKLDSSNPLVNDELMLCILVDSIVAVLDSPVSVPAQRLLHEHHEEGPG